MSPTTDPSADPAVEGEIVTGRELEPLRGAGVELEQVEDVHEAALALAGLREVEEVDPAQISAAIILRIVQADTDEEAARSLPVYGTKSSIGKEFLLRNARMLRSKYPREGVTGAYMIADAVDLATGEECLLATSAARPAAWLLRWHMRGDWPHAVRVYKLTDGKVGPVLDFEHLDLPRDLAADS